MDVTAEIEGHIARTYPKAGLISDLADRFSRDGFVLLRDLVPDTVKKHVSNEVHRLMRFGNRIDLVVETTGSSPRKMTTVGMRKIEQNSRLIPELYSCHALRAFLARITGEALQACPWEEERYVIIKQENAGDTHGWHWGDYAFTLIWLIEVPEDPGGKLQCIPNTRWNKQDPQLERYLAANTPDTYGFETGDVYLLRSDTTLHRTTPLTCDCTRIILNTCWASAADLESNKTHETMNQMFQ